MLFLNLHIQTYSCFPAFLKQTIYTEVKTYVHVFNLFFTPYLLWPWSLESPSERALLCGRCANISVFCNAVGAVVSHKFVLQLTCDAHPRCSERHKVLKWFLQREGNSNNKPQMKAEIKDREAAAELALQIIQF